MDRLDASLNDILPLIDTERTAELGYALADIEKTTDFDSFDAAAAFAQKEFQSAGMACDVLRFPADGQTMLHSYMAPIGFRTRRAACWLVEPDGRRTLLGDRATEPNTAIVGTGHTGPEGLEAPAVHVTSMADFDALDIRGKIVFTDRLNPQDIRARAVAGGAAAVVSSFTTIQGADAFVKWNNTWDSQPDGWLPTARAARENLPGISLSPATGQALAARLAARPGLRLRVVTEGEYFEGTFPGVWAQFDGAEAGPAAILTGHMFEAGVWDNASGVMTARAISETLIRLLDRQGRGRFRRGWCNFHSQECYGVLALHRFQPRRLDGLLGHVDLDAVGVANQPVGLGRGLRASAGFSDILFRIIFPRAAAMAGHAWKVRDGFDMNCTLLAEPAVGGIPTHIFIQEHDSWHISRDRRGHFVFGPSALRLCILAGAAWLRFLADAGTDDALWLLERYEEELRQTLGSGACPDTDLHLRTTRREVETLLGLVAPGDQAAFRDGIEDLFGSLAKAAYPVRRIEPPGSEGDRRRCAALRPRTVIAGPPVADLFTAADVAEIGETKWNEIHIILKSWADGTRTVEEIARLAAYERPRLIEQGFSYGRALRIFEAYARAGVVTV